MNTAQHYNRLSPFYFIIYSFLKGHKKHLINAVNNFPTGTILEVGVGHGTHLKHYKSNSITAIDISEKMLIQAKKNNPSNLTFIKMDALNLNQLGQKFDTIVLSHVISTSKKGNELISSCFNALQPNGRLIILNHFTTNKTIGIFEQLFQPIARLFHFQSYYPFENLTVLKDLKKKKALKFGFLNSYQLVILEKT